MKPVLVTGATGMIGARVVARLRGQGAAVRAPVRPRSDARALEAAGVEVVRIGEDGTGLAQAARGVDSIVHAAGALSTGAAFSRGDAAAKALYQAVNVDLTDRLLGAAGGVRRFVYVSSCAVYGAPRSGQPIGEDAALNPASAYGASKLAAEGRVAQAQTEGLSTAIVRPCIVCGPGDRHLAPAVAALARLPLLPLPRGGRSCIDLAQAEDVADLILLCLQRPAADGRTYNATSNAPVALKDLVQGLAQKLGLRPRILSVPGPMMTALRPLLALGLHWADTPAAPLLGPIGLSYLMRDTVFDVRRAQAELGFRPRWSIEAMLDALAAAARAQL